jgi:microcystin-dependent protein
MKYRENESEPWKELYIKALDSMPIGAMIEFVGTDIPNGWLICDGSTLDEETYPELYDALGGSGSTFTLPNYQGRVPVGYDANDTDFNAIGKTGGEKTHTLTIDEMPSHYHQQALGGALTTTDQVAGVGVVGKENVSNTKNTGGDQPHNNLQPYIVQYWIIKAKNTTPTMASIVNTKNNSTTDGYSCDWINKHPSTIYKFKTGSISVRSGFNTAQVGTLDTIDGYTLVGMQPKVNGYADQNVCSYSIYAGGIYYSCYSTGNYTLQLEYYEIFVRNDCIQ